ncbi:MAG: 2,3-bisphosphoglycerate-independent phosphoglycerate mutase [Verrucomicrobiota bacterium]
MQKTYPVSYLSASGEDVGLPAGQMGNSEVGHLNLGAGRVVYQDLSRINRAIENADTAKNANITEAFAKAKTGRLHLIGLVSDGGVHSHQDHLLHFADLARECGVEDIMVHAITDGRDTSPTGGAGFLSDCEDRLAQAGARIGTVIGRYFAMDRDSRWDRTRLAWDAIVLGKGESSDLLPSEAVAECYRNDKTDEFLQPIIFSNPDEQRIRDGDVVLFFNFRADRARQLSRAFLYPDFDGFDRTVVPRVHYLTLTEYDATYPCPAAFPPEDIRDGLGETVSGAGKSQVRIAETEKYPHVTYFFNGGIEEPFKGEDRVIVPSPKVATYDLQPEMSADEVTAKVLEWLPKVNLMILNFANPDMVGHTGSVEAAIKAVETIDGAVKAVTEKVLELDGQLLITADHGNCEQMIKKDGSPHTAHTTNLVHLWYVANEVDGKTLEDGILADVAPTLLDMLDVPVPAAMTGKSLLKG